MTFVAGAEFPDECLFAVVALRPTQEGPTIVAGGVQVQLNCDPDLAVGVLRSVADAIEADVNAERAARLN